MEERENKRGNFIVNIVFNAIFLYVVNRIPVWNLAFITESFPSVLWALNLSIIVQLSGYFILVFYHPSFLYRFMQVLFAVVSAVAMYTLLRVFPFNFDQVVGSWLTTLVRIVLIIGLVGTVIGGIVHALHIPGALRRLYTQERFEEEEE